MVFFFSKFSLCQVTSQEAPWIEKPSGSSVLPGLNKLTVILFMCVCFVCVCIAEANKLFSIYLSTLILKTLNFQVSFLNKFDPNSS